MKMSLKNLAKAAAKIEVFNVGRNRVPNTLTADRESALPEPSPCPHETGCVNCTGTELAASEFCGVELHDVAEICRSASMKFYITVEILNSIHVFLRNQ